MDCRLGQRMYIKILGILILVCLSSRATTSTSSGPPQHLQFMVQPTSRPYEQQGTKRFLSCSAAGQPHPDYSWIKDSRPLESPTVMTMGTLMISNIGPSDEGTYRCKVEHAYGALVSTGAQVKVAYINQPDDSHREPIERTATQGQALILDPPSVDSLPALVPQWMEGGTSEGAGFRRLGTSDPFYHVTSEGQLIVLDVKDQEDGKMFQVVASNPALPGVSVVLTYRLLVHKDVQFKFEMVVPPKDVLASSSSPSAQFECVANSRPLSSLDTSWYFKSERQQEETKIFSNDNKHLLSKYNRLLTIRHVAQSDEGTYRCEVTTSSPVGQTSYLSRSARLIFQAAPTSSYHRPNTVVMNFDSGEHVNLRCDIVGSPRPLIKWYYNARVIDDHSRSMVQHDNSLRISRATKADSGYYQCFGSNSLGETYLAYYVNVTATVPVIVNMSPDGDVVVTRGTMVTLHCNSKGIPRPEVTWRQVEHVSDTSRVISLTTLEVNRIEIEARATSTFICEARNAEGQVDRSVRIRTAAPTRLFGLSSPGVESPGLIGNVSVVAGRSFSLACLAAFDSALVVDRLHVSWSKNGAGVKTGMIGDARGGGKTGRSGEAFSDIAVSEREVAIFSSDESERESAEKLKSIVGGSDDSDDVGEKIGRELGRPDPGSHLVLRRLDLVVTEATREHDGTYECRVKTSVGLEKISTRVIVMGPPGQPFNVTSSLSRFGIPWITVQWMAGHDGNSPIRKHVIYALINDNLDPLNETRPGWEVVEVVEHRPAGANGVATFTIKGRPSHSYVFCVSSVNEVGEGARSETTADLRVPMQIPSSPPMNVTSRSSDESSVVLTWEPPERGEWNGPLLGYTTRYRMSEEFRRLSAHRKHHQQQHQQWKDVNSYSSINVLDGKSRELKIDNLRPFTTYEFSVAAYNGIGIGPYSAPVAVTTEEGAPRVAPGHVTVAAVNSTAVNVTFKLHDLEKFNGFVRGCRIYAEKMFDEQKSVPAEFAGKMVRDFVLETSSPPSLESYLTSSPVYSFVVDGLSKFTWHEVSTSCYNGRAEGPRSEGVKVRTEEDLPEKVAAMRLTEVTDVSFSVTWSPPAEPNGVLTGYRLTFRAAGKSTVHWLESGQTSYRIAPFEFETRYEIEVSAATRVGVGAKEELRFTTPPPPEFPLPPTEVSVEEVSSRSVSLLLRRRQSTYVRWIVEVSAGPDRDVLALLPDKYLSDVLPVDREEIGGGRGSLFSEWRVAREVESSAAELEVPIVLEGLKPYAVYGMRVRGENSKGRSRTKRMPHFLATEGSAPDLDPGAFCGSVVHSGRKVKNGVDLTTAILKWMPLPRSSWHGPRDLSFFRISGSSCHRVTSGEREGRPGSAQSPSRGGCLESFDRHGPAVDFLTFPSNSTMGRIGFSESCRCPSLGASACNEHGCSREVPMELVVAAADDRGSGGSRIVKEGEDSDVVVGNVSVIPVGATRVLVLWGSSLPEADGGRRTDGCSAFKISYWREFTRPDQHWVKAKTKRSSATGRPQASRASLSDRPKFKIVSGEDRHSVVDGLLPGTPYGFRVKALRAGEVHRHGGLAGEDSAIPVGESPEPVFAATWAEHRDDKSVSSLSSRSSVSWNSHVRTWMIIVASVVSGLLLVVVVISIYVTVHRRTRPEKKKPKQTTAGTTNTATTALDTTCYDPVETTNRGRAKRSSWKLGGRRGKRVDPALYGGKAPPRPSPGSIQFNNNNDPNKSPNKFPDEFQFPDPVANDGEDDDDAPPLPPPPEVDPYDPDSIFSRQPATRVSGAVTPVGHFSTLPGVGSCYHADDFVIDYYPQHQQQLQQQQLQQQFFANNCALLNQNQPPTVNFNQTLPSHAPLHHHHPNHHQYHHQHQHHLHPSYQHPYGGHATEHHQPLPPPPSPLQLEQLWLQRRPVGREGAMFYAPPPFGNPVGGSESETGEVRCMTIGRRYKSPKVAPYA